ncbi:MAG: TetR/AcrR family transcriptional regulator [Chitinophagaceae bacterium]
MGIAERKEKQKLEIKKLILEASIKLFMEEGFENVSIRKIADLIEYSPTTVYLYFRDKNDIFLHLHELGFQKMQEMNQNLQNIANPLVRLYKMGENYLQFGIDNPEFYDLMFIQKAPMQALRTKMQENCAWSQGDTALATLQAIIQDCMDKGLMKQGPIEAVSLTIWGMVHGLVSLYIRERLESLVTVEKTKEVMFNSLNWMMATLDSSTT